MKRSATHEHDLVQSDLSLTDDQTSDRCHVRERERIVESAGHVWEWTADVTKMRGGLTVLNPPSCGPDDVAVSDPHSEHVEHVYPTVHA